MKNFPFDSRMFGKALLQFFKSRPRRDMTLGHAPHRWCPAPREKTLDVGRDRVAE